MYLGLIALWRTVEDPVRAGRAAAVLTLVGASTCRSSSSRRLVEHAASAGVGVPARRADHSCEHFGAAVRHGDRLQRCCS